MDHARPNFFAGPYIDRRADAREQAGWVEAARVDPATLYMVGKGTAQLVRSKSEPRVEFLTNDHPIVAEADPRKFTLLGWFRGIRCVLVDLEPARSVDLPAGATRARGEVAGGPVLDDCRFCGAGREPGRRGCA